MNKEQDFNNVLLNQKLLLVKSTLEDADKYSNLLYTLISTALSTLNNCELNENSTLSYSVISTTNISTDKNIDSQPFLQNKLSLNKLDSIDELRELQSRNSISQEINHYFKTDLFKVEYDYELNLNENKLNLSNCDFFYNDSKEQIEKDFFLNKNDFNVKNEGESNRLNAYLINNIDSLKDEGNLSENKLKLNMCNLKELSNKCMELIKIIKDLNKKSVGFIEMSINNKTKCFDSVSFQVSNTSNEDNVRKYNMFNIDLKKQAVEFARKHGLNQALDKFKVPRKSLKRWLTVGPERKKGGGRKIKDPEMERKLLIWYNEYIKINKQVSHSMIKEMAIKFRSDDKFLASKGWLEKFKQKQNLVLSNGKS